MTHLPDFETFRTLAQDAQLVPVYRRLVSDSPTVVSAFHKLDTGEAACLFESVIGGEKVGRYSFLAAEPFLRLEAHGPQVKVVDAAAFSLCMDNKLPMVVFGMEGDGNITRALRGERIGTLVSAG